MDYGNYNGGPCPHSVIRVKMKIPALFPLTEVLMKPLLPHGEGRRRSGGRRNAVLRRLTYNVLVFGGLFINCSFFRLRMKLR